MQSKSRTISAVRRGRAALIGAAVGLALTVGVGPAAASAAEPDAKTIERITAALDARKPEGVSKKERRRVEKRAKRRGAVLKQAGGWDGCVTVGNTGVQVCAYYSGFASGLDPYMYILLRDSNGNHISYGYEIIWILESRWRAWLGY